MKVSIVLALQLIATIAASVANAEIVGFDDVIVNNVYRRFPADQFRSKGIVFDGLIPIQNVLKQDPSFAQNVFEPGGGSLPNALSLTLFFDSDLDIVGTFVLPGTVVPGVTDSVSVRVFDAAANSGTSAGTLEAYDLNGQLLESVSMTTPSSGAAFLYSISQPGIASIRLLQDDDGGLFDNLTFNTPTPASGARNLILNGSFEEAGDLSSVVDPNTGLARDPAPTVPPNEDDAIYVLPPTSQGIAHWEVEIDPDLFNPEEPGATIDWVHTSHYAASHGERSVDLNGTPGPGGIKQTFATTPGVTYSLLFDLAGNPVGNEIDPESGLTVDPVKHLRVELQSDGEIFYSWEPDDGFDVTGQTPEDVGWITEGWTFTAVGTETTLRFKSLAWSVDGTSGDPFFDLMDFGPTIDNVRVYQATVPGDLNGDGLVGSGDLDIVRAHWGETVTPGDLTMGDVSGDGYVGSADLDTVRSHWGGSIAASVPEPGVIILLTIGLSLCLLRRRAA